MRCPSPSLYSQPVLRERRDSDGGSTMDISDARAPMSASAERVASGRHERKSRTGLIPIGETAVSHFLDRVCTLLAAAGILLLAIRRWMLVGSFPPGLDGAQWLALGRGL